MIYSCSRVSVRARGRESFQSIQVSLVRERVRWGGGGRSPALISVGEGLLMTLRVVLLISRQGKVRLGKWYAAHTTKERNTVVREVTNLVLARPGKLCNFLEWREYKLIYKRYASLFFITCVDKTDNELITLEIIHQFVEVLDRYFGNVCELDLIFNFHKAYYILDELVIAGEQQETSKKAVLKLITEQDAVCEEGTDKDMQ